MKYHLSHLVAASLGERATFYVQEGARALDKDLEIDFLQGEIQFIRTNQGIYAQGRLQTRVNVACVRCLESLSYPLDFEIAEQYLFSYPEDAQEPVYLVTVDGTIDITEPTRQQIWVSLPAHPLCRPDCRGLCSHCGANLNYETCACREEVIDPRLAILKKLL